MVLECCDGWKEDNSKKEDIMVGYKRLKDKLGKPGDTDRVSEDILDLLVQ